MDDQGEYILNGYSVITQYSRSFPYGGVTFEYTGTNSTLEKVNTTFARRLKRDLTVEVGPFYFLFFNRRLEVGNNFQISLKHFLQILSRNDKYVTNELIRFSFTMDLNEARNSHMNFYPYNHNQASQNHQNGRNFFQPSIQYKWEMSEWSECNSLCDGEQYRTPACMQSDNGQVVSPNLCRDRKPDDEYQVCNAGCVVE